MKIQMIKNRSMLFTETVGGPDGWALNIHLIRGSRYDYLIDTGLGARSVEPVMEYLDVHKPLFIINTHHHWDHTWGNGALERAVIVAHAACPALMQEKWSGAVEKFGRFQSGEVSMRLPDLLFENTLAFPGDGIRLFHTPGHTEDSISILDEKDGVLNLADNIGDNMDELVPSLACDNEVYRTTLGLYQQLDFDTVLSGHNVVLGREVLDKILNELK